MFRLTIFDKYIIKKYLTTFAFTVLIFTMIAVVVDFSEKVEDFIEDKPPLRAILFDYYLNFIPHINSLLFPLYALISVIFFTSRMAYDSEIISVFSAGISFQRFLKPYMIAASVIAFLHLVGNHYFIPEGNKRRLEFEHTYVWHNNDKGKTDNVHMFLDPNTKVYIRYYRKRDTVARDFRVEKFKNGELEYVLKAATAQWLGRPNKWRLTDYEIHTFNGLNETITRSMGRDLDTTYNLTPEDFVRFIDQKEMMTSGEISDYIASQNSRGMGNTKALEIEMQRRTADPFTIFILTLIGASVAARKVRGGIGFHLALGMALGAVFIFLSKFSATFATGDSIPALVGVWIPNVFFLGVAAFLFTRAQK